MSTFISKLFGIVDKFLIAKSSIFCADNTNKIARNVKNIKDIKDTT